MNDQSGNTQARQTEISQENYIRDHGLELDSMGLEGSQGNLAELLLLENGMILDCNRASGELLGCEPEKLKWQPIARVLPQLANMLLVMDKRINPYLRFLSIAGHRYEVTAVNGKQFACELFFSMVEDVGRRCLKITMRPIKHAATLRHLRTY